MIGGGIAGVLFAAYTLISTYNFEDHPEVLGTAVILSVLLFAVLVVKA